MSPRVPERLSSGHERIHEKLHGAILEATMAQGVVGNVARAVTKRIHARRMKGAQSMAFAIPQSLKLEHDELHAELVEATKAGGRVGEAAKGVAKALHPHFVKEEEYALPPLGVLSLLAEGKITPGMASVVAMTDKLRVDLPHMLEEHKAIVAALENLRQAAEAEGQAGPAHFAEKLMLHAQTEEQITYPTALLIGDYLRLRLGT